MEKMFKMLCVGQLSLQFYWTYASVRELIKKRDSKLSLQEILILEVFNES